MFGKKRRGIVPRFRYQSQIDLLTRALGHLPDEVQEFLQGRLVEISSDGVNAYAQTRKDREASKDTYAVIHLHWHIWECYDDEEIMRIILHEIAKVYKDISVDISEEERSSQDRMLDDLVASWGFRRRSLEECRRREVRGASRGKSPHAVEQHIEFVDHVLPDSKDA